MANEKTTLADFFKAIAEEKKKLSEAPVVKEEIIEEKSELANDYFIVSNEKATLADFFKAIAEEKRKKDGTAPIIDKIIEETSEGIDDYVTALKGEKPFFPEKLPELLENPEDKPVILPEPEPQETIESEPVKEQEDFLNKIDLRNYVTQEDLNKHYKTFVERVQKQLSTLGGGGEKEFRFLDDIDRTTIGPNKYLSYNPITKKFFFEEVISGGTGGLDSALVSQFVDSAYVQLRQSQILDDSYTTSLQDNVLSVINLPQNTPIGPIEQLSFNTNHTHEEVRVPGTLCWDPNDLTLNLTHPGGVTQQIGQETYALVRNNTGATIPNGTAVRFSGADQPGHIPFITVDGQEFITQDSLSFNALEAAQARLEVTPFLADGTYPSLYGLGITTQDIADGEDGKVTVWGKVRDINTSAFNIGDILYVSPSVAGGLTNVKPTAPNNVVPMAAVLRVDSSIGEIFVRPNYEQQKNYGNFVSDSDQTLSLANTAEPIRLSRDLRAFQMQYQDSDRTRIQVFESGLYAVTVNAQVTSTNSSSKNVYFWLRKNDSDLTGTTRILTIAGNAVFRTFASTNTVSLDANDTIQHMWASTDPAVTLQAVPATAFAPSSPSVKIDVTQAAL